MKTLKNIINVILSNITTIISGLVVSFLLPKIISMTDYGFYKIFSLYLNYIGVLSLGIIDGIVLKYGGKNLEEFEKEKFRSLYLLYILVNLFFSIVIVVISLLLKDIDYSFIILMLAANVLPANIFGYFQQISQITLRFKEYSIVKIIQSVLNVLLIVMFFLQYYFTSIIINYRLYLIGLLFINLVIMIWYSFRYKIIIFGKREKIRNILKEFFELIKIGFPLLVSNLCTTLILSLNRQIVSIFFETEEYAVYAFSYSLLSLVTIATSAISTVLYPVFKRMDKDTLAKKYYLLCSIVLIFSFFLVLGYYPLYYFINWFLPQYSDSLIYFKIILPGVAISTVVTVIIHNYCKVFDKSTVFFINSVIALLFSIIINLLAYYLFKNIKIITYTSIVCLFVWFLINERSLCKVCTINQKNIFYLVMLTIIFYMINLINKLWLCLILYLLIYLVLTILFYKKYLKEIKLFLKKKK